MNHRWSDNKCAQCGLVREMKDYSRVVRTYSALGRDGCWYDVPVYEYGRKYWYGHLHKFERPDCKRSKITTTT